MSPDIPPAPPEAEVIRLAREAADMTAQDAADASRAHDGRGVSASYWRDVERGYGGRRGKRVPTRASARALASMARVVGVAPAQLAAAGRADAARVVEESLRRDAPTVLAITSNLGPLPTTEAMAQAIAAHIEEVGIRVELAHRKFPGQKLTGSMVFPLDPRSASYWDLVAGDEEFAGDEAGIAQGVAALRAWRQEKARADGNRAATG